MTVTSVTLGPTSLPHLHFNSEIVGLDLVNHYDCCSTPYLFTFSTAVDLLGFDVVQNSITGLNTWTSSGGGLFSVSAGTGFFDVTTSGGPGWSGITSFTWDLPGSGTGLLGIDNLHIEVTEPMTVGLLGLGLLGLGFARRRLH